MYIQRSIIFIFNKHVNKIMPTHNHPLFFVRSFGCAYSVVGIAYIGLRASTVKRKASGHYVIMLLLL